MRDFDAVHLAYCKAGSSESSYLSILFWQGIASYGYTEILTVGSIVACSNLEWRRATSWNVPAAYCTDRSTFTRNPRRNHLYESFENLRNLIMVRYIISFFRHVFCTIYNFNIIIFYTFNYSFLK